MFTALIMDHTDFLSGDTAEKRKPLLLLGRGRCNGRNRVELPRRSPYEFWLMILPWLPPNCHICTCWPTMELSPSPVSYTVCVCAPITCDQLHLCLRTVNWEPALHVVITVPTKAAGPFTFSFLPSHCLCSGLIDVHMSGQKQQKRLSYSTLPTFSQAFHGDTTGLVNQPKPQSYSLWVTAPGKLPACVCVCLSV